MEKDTPCKNQQEIARMAILISDKIKTNIFTRDKERHFIMMKALIYQEDVTVISMHAPNNRAPKYTRYRRKYIKQHKEREQGKQG